MLARVASEPVGSRLAQIGRATPRDRHVVARVVDGAQQVDTPRAAPLDRRPVRVWAGPVERRGVLHREVVAAREREPDTQPSLREQRGVDAHGDEVEVRVAAVVTFTARPSSVAALDHAAPEVERLARLADVVGADRLERDLPERQVVRVAAEPLAGVAVGVGRVGDRAPVRLGVGRLASASVYPRGLGSLCQAQRASVSVGTP